MKLIISDTTPSKKNSRINTRSGRSFPSKRFSAWEAVALPELKEQFTGYKVTDYPIALTMVFYNGDLRRHDLDNQSSSILDTMVKAGVIEDDNQKYVDCITLQYGGVDRENPRCEVFLDE
jgi:Holliday junction resolvase RusA-like endonuclease